MCKTIEELDEKNDVAHKILSEKIEEVKKSMATKADLAQWTPKIDAARTVSGSQKTIIIVVLAFLTLMGAASTAFIGFSYKDSHKSMTEQIKLNTILTSINTKIAESNSVAKNFDAKAIMDSITIHWKAENKFYQGEYLNNKNWTRKVAAMSIYPTELRSKRNELLLKDHEMRIVRLEKINGIKSILK